LEREQIRFGEKSVPLTMRDSARSALMNGRWDTIAELLEGAEAVRTTAASLPYIVSND
jgi:3-isopropylmalate/(R)-2-methylmalate dehydratase small subunit